MAYLSGKKIIVSISGSIAAYKSAILVRLLVKEGAAVRVLMTPAATEFISPLTLSTLSKNKVYTNIFDEGEWNNHVDLGLWADAMIIAPATANTLGKAASGIADNMVIATYLSAKCPIMFAPAMDLDMWHHASTQQNLDKLRSYGNLIIPVGFGELASGLTGEGRMAEPEEIIRYLKNYFKHDLALEGQKVLVNAGPTQESIDPVRFIGNRSTGKMGISIAEAFANKGADVELVLGPTHLSSNHANINITKVVSAEDMYDATVDRFSNCQIAILSAAVADYTPSTVSDEKIKKKEGDLNIELKRTKDIAKYLGSIKSDDQILVGFALESNNGLDYARAKLATKNLDMIVLNSLKDKGAGFQYATNKVTFLFPGNKEEEFELKLKTEVAEDIVRSVIKLSEEKKEHA